MLFASAPSAVDLGRQALQTALLLGGPLLLIAMLSGLLISIIQSVTQIQDPAISFGAKVAAVATALIVSLPWLIDSYVCFWQESFSAASPVLGN